MKRDAVYFGRRAREERVAAMMAPDSRARQAHLDMADRYNELALAIASRQPATGPELIGAP